MRFGPGVEGESVGGAVAEGPLMNDVSAEK